jgi:hypothetical protein
MTDWCKTELAELAKIDIEFNEVNNTLHQMRFALKAKRYDSNIAFNDNKYNAVDYNLIKCMEHYYLDFLLDIISRLEEDILMIQSFGVFLQNYSRFKKFEEAIRTISDKNRHINLAISQMEEKILLLIQDIREINVYNVELDDELLKDKMEGLNR